MEMRLLFVEFFELFIAIFQIVHFLPEFLDAVLGTLLLVCQTYHLLLIILILRFELFLKRAFIIGVYLLPDFVLLLQILVFALQVLQFLIKQIVFLLKFFFCFRHHPLFGDKSKYFSLKLPLNQKKMHKSIS